MAHKTANPMLRRARVLLLGVSVAAGSACSDLLDVQADVVTGDAIANASGAEALRVAAVGRMGQVLTGTAGGATGLIPVSGVLSDEMIVTSPRAGLEAVDSRLITEANEESYITSQYTRLSQARLLAREAMNGMMQFSPQRRASIGEMYAMLAFAEILMAEHFCSGITLSSVVAGRPEYGSPMTTTEVFNLALAHGDSALALATDSARITNLARVARGRTLLNLGRFDDAAAAVSSVPTNFVYNLEFAASPSAVQNGLTTWLNQARIYSVANNKGTNGLNFQSAADPRLPVRNAGIGQDGRHQAWVPTRYDVASAPVALADGVEARLIQAEALLRNNDHVGALAILNDLRTRVTGLAPLADAGSPGARVDQLFRERAFWMFATAHRTGDLRRLVRQYQRDQATVFPTGEYFKGGNYGTEVTFPIPLQESNNPNSVGCINRSA